MPEAAPSLLCGTPALPVGQREFAAEVSWDLPSLAPGATSLLDVTVNGARQGDLAHALRDRPVVDDGVSADDFAAREGVTPSWVTRLARLACLAPDIVAAILEGQQPVERTANRLLQDTRLPIDRTEQRARLGFG
ncbi:hypothetical protein [Neoroseomonas soli]|uniref:Uncharacterized protein n=1 Tax=Neoroseomonas soli TaxID=1081025 RepID=A0A9X9WX85_9PROT|nr:hypothetical protein [Neoroseomonas soli]MBR0671764.1 hypothetical protein [Neoroseomonas soli]